MRTAAISIISIFACIPAFANARLPIVNVGAGSVSARAAFGETVNRAHTAAHKVDTGAQIVQIKETVKPTANVNPKSQISNLKSSDVLIPKRPSADLWARIEKPLRLPEAGEISVIRSDYELPEESLDMDYFADASYDMPVAYSNEVASVKSSTSELDAQIARLVDLQKKADNSIHATAPRKSSTISSYDVKPAAAIAQRRAAPVVEERVAVSSNLGPQPSTLDEVAVRRVVVPVDEDIIVRQVRSDDAPKFSNVREDNMAKMSPTELKKAFKKTYLSENKHLSTYRIDDRFDVASEPTVVMEGFTSTRDLSEAGGVRPLEIKIGFRGEDSSLSRDNYNLLSEYAAIVVSNPKRAIQISIPERSTRSLDDRKLAARRLAIVEQVLRDTGVSDQRIMPVLAQRNDDSFVLRVISSDQFETMTQQKRDMFGDTTSKKTYKSMTW